MKNKNNTMELARLLHQRDDETREVVIAATSYSLVYILKAVGSRNTSLDIKKLVDTICELAIIDRVALEKSISNFYNLSNINNTNNILSNLYASDTLEDALLINKYVGNSVISNVNKHISLFKEIVFAYENNAEYIMEVCDNG